MAAVMLFAATGAFASAATPVKAVKQEVKKEATTQSKKGTAHKAHKKHHAKAKAKTAAAPKAK